MLNLMLDQSREHIITLLFVMMRIPHFINISKEMILTSKLKERQNKKKQLLF